MQKKVLIYVSPASPHCAEEREYLKEKKITHESFNILEDPYKKEEMKKKSNQLEVPVFDIEGEIIIGFDPRALNKALGIK